MTHPETYSLLCSMIRIAGYAIEPDHFLDGARASVVHPGSQACMGYLHTEEPHWRAIRGPSPLDRLVRYGLAVAGTCSETHAWGALSVSGGAS